MHKLKLALFRLRYPTPDEGDFGDEIPLDIMTGNDGNDNNVSDRDKGA